MVRILAEPARKRQDENRRLNHETRERHERGATRIGWGPGAVASRGSRNSLFNYESREWREWGEAKNPLPARPADGGHVVLMVPARRA